MRQICMSGSMSGVWKRSHGRTSEAPPDERGGNRYVRPTATAPHSDSTDRIFSNLKVWALGVYHGLRRQHLQSYLDEFFFRFNRRRRAGRIPILARHRRRAPPRPYKMLVLPEAKA